jgi:hypothetical protein
LGKLRGRAIRGGRSGRKRRQTAAEVVGLECGRCGADQRELGVGEKSVWPAAILLAIGISAASSSFNL